MNIIWNNDYYCWIKVWRVINNSHSQGRDSAIVTFRFINGIETKLYIQESSFFLHCIHFFSCIAPPPSSRKSYSLLWFLFARCLILNPCQIRLNFIDCTTTCFFYNNNPNFYCNFCFKVWLLRKIQKGKVKLKIIML